MWILLWNISVAGNQVVNRLIQFFCLDIRIYWFCMIDKRRNFKVSSYSMNSSVLFFIKKCLV